MSEQNFHVGVKAIIRNTSEKILLVSVNKKIVEDPSLWQWDFPGGRIEEGYDEENTLKKEIKEELGYTGKIHSEFYSYCVAKKMIPTKNGRVKLLLIVFEVTVEKDIGISLSDEHVEYDWFIASEVRSRLSEKYPQEFLDKIK